MHLPGLESCGPALESQCPSHLLHHHQTMSEEVCIIQHTDVFLQSPLCLHVILLELIVEFLQSFKILDVDTHLLDFLKPK